MLLLSLLSPTLLAAPPGVGDVVITEVMPAPRNQSTREWIELVNVSGGEVDLSGCQLIEGHDTGSGWAGNAHEVVDYCVDAGAEALLHRSVEVGDCAVWDGPEESAACYAEVGYQYRSLSFGNSDAELLCLVCGAVDAAAPCTNSTDIIDVVEVNWAAFEAACEAAHDGADRNCSIELQVDPDALANDDQANWAVGQSPYYDTSEGSAASREAWGTPRNTNTCVVVSDTGGGDTGGGDDTGEVIVDGPACEAGQVIFTELMPAPRDGAYADEWMELYGVASAMGGEGYCQLYGCELTQHDPSDDSVTAGPLVLGSAGLPVAGGEFAVVARSSSDDRDLGISWTRLEDGALSTADYLYGYNDFNLPNDEDRILRLSCEGQVVDEVRLDWSVFVDEAEARCPWDRDAYESGCSINLGAWAHGAAANVAEPLANWCIAPGPSETEPDRNLWAHTEPDGDTWTLQGTPGVEGDCPEYERPAPGELIFTELAADGAETPDWFEITNLVDSDKELTGCTVRRYRLNEEGLRDSVAEDVIGADGSAPVALGLTSLVFAEDGCLTPLTVDSGEPTAADCPFVDVIVRSVNFTTTNTEWVELVCPTLSGEEQLIDSISINWEVAGARDGHSLMFDVGAYSDPAVDNDDQANWCEAAFSQEFLEVEEGACNYGTPGELGECTTDTFDYPVGGPACRCQSTSPAGALWLAWLLPLLGIRRRAARA